MYENELKEKQNDVRRLLEERDGFKTIQGHRKKVWSGFKKN